MRYQITLPLPPKSLSPNRKLHYQQVATARRQYLADCLTALRCQPLPRLTGRVTLHFDFYQWRGGTAAEKFARSGYFFGADADNCLSSAKKAIDSLVVAGVIEGDSAREVRIGEVTLRRCQREHGGETKLVVTLETEEEIE